MRRKTKYLICHLSIILIVLKNWKISYRNHQLLNGKGKKFTEKTCFAISSFEWKLNEEKKFKKQKIEKHKKKARRIELSEKKKIAQNEKKAKQLTKLQKQK